MMITRSKMAHFRPYMQDRLCQHANDYVHMRYNMYNG